MKSELHPSSRKTLTVYSAALFLMVLGLFLWIRVHHLLQPPDVYDRDFIQTYLMGQAASAQEPIYQQLDSLANRFNSNLAHHHSQPSAYPPPFAFLALPLSLMNYEHSFRLWIFIEIACFLTSLGLLLWAFNSHKPECLIVATIFVLAQPFYLDLYQGQVMMLALLCLTSSWLLIRSGHEKAGGIPLGVLLALKFYAWPVALFLLMTKRSHALLVAIAVVLSTNVLAALWLGADQVSDYYFRVGPLISASYVGHEGNFSAISLAWNYFGWRAGTGAALVLLSAVLALAFRARTFDHGFMITLVSSVVLSPVSWTHYLVTLLPAFCWIVCRFFRSS